MCLIFAAYKVHPKHPLIILANRDEFTARPTQPAHWWAERDVLAGKDLKAGGTWLGVNSKGKFAALTNVRDPKNFRAEAASRGSLVLDFLSADSIADFKQKRLQDVSIYNDFNLLLYENEQLFSFNSQARALQTLSPGIYGLSNDNLDSNWPKINRGKAMVADLVEQESIDAANAFSIMKDAQLAADESLPSTGVTLEMERLLSPMFIRFDGYGTRSSNVVLFNADDSVDFYEQQHYSSKEVCFRFFREK